MTGTQTCTAMVETKSVRSPVPGWIAHVVSRESCGKPVAKLGPCQQVMGEGATHWHCELLTDHPNHNIRGAAGDHQYRGTLKHVTLGLCACGHAESEHAPDEPGDEGFPATCEACEPDPKWTAVHSFALTVIERKGVGHDAEVRE